MNLMCSTCRSWPRSWFVTGFVTRVTRRVSLVEQELLTLPEYLSSPLVLSGFRVTWSLVLCTYNVLQIVVCLFVLFLLAIVHVLSVLLRFTDSDYPFCIFKFFFGINFQHWLYLGKISVSWVYKSLYQPHQKVINFIISIVLFSL